MNKHIEKPTIEEEYLQALAVCLQESLSGEEYMDALTEQYCDLVSKINIGRSSISNVEFSKKCRLK